MFKRFLFPISILWLQTKISNIMCKFSERVHNCGVTIQPAGRVVHAAMPRNVGKLCLPRHFPDRKILDWWTCWTGTVQQSMQSKRVFMTYIRGPLMGPGQEVFLISCRQLTILTRSYCSYIQCYQTLLSPVPYLKLYQELQ